jgi:hypothetical protein
VKAAVKRTEAASCALAELLDSRHLGAGVQQPAQCLDVLEWVAALCAQALTPLTWAALGISSGSRCPTSDIQPNSHSSCGTLTPQAAGACLGLVMAPVCRMVAELAQSALLQHRDPSTLSLDAESSSGGARIAGLLVQVILSLASIACPYSCTTTVGSGADRDTTSAAMPSWMWNFTGVSTNAQVQAGAAWPGAEAALLQVTTAATALLRRLPMPELVCRTPPLLELGLRLLSTSPSSGSMLGVSRVYLERCASIVCQRLQAAALDERQPVSTVDHSSAVTAVACAVEGAFLHLTTDLLTQLSSDPLQERQRTSAQLSTLLGASALLSPAALRSCNQHGTANATSAIGRVQAGALRLVTTVLQYR